MIDATPMPETLATRAGALFEQFRDGDESKMTDLVTLLTPILWHTARAQRLDSHSAEDVVQSSWLALVRHASSITSPQAVLHWLVVTVRRESWRVVARQRKVDPTNIDDLTAPAAPADQPELAVLTRAGDTVLWRNVTALPERCQQLLRVIAFADRPDYSAVAEALGMPVGSIGPTRGRCLAKLRSLLTADPTWGNE
ncbi:MAG: RNA polymerase sigma factor [Jatrophihabitans sp.]